MLLRDDLRRYGLAMLILAAAIAARVVVDSFAPSKAPFLTFPPAVLAAAWLCGGGPAALVLVLASTASWWAWPDEPVTVRIGTAAVFFVFNAAIIYFMDRLAKAQAAIAAHEEQLKLINQELNHRIKNLFAIANSICSNTVKAGLPPEDTVKAISGRFRSIATAQDLLGMTSSAGARVGDLVEALVMPMAPDRSRIQFNGPTANLRAEDTTPLALVLHELATNALKYGAWSDPAGVVVINWSVSASVGQQQLEFVWAEHDGPQVAPLPREGLGSKLIRQALPGATIEHDLKVDGLRCRIRLQLPQQEKSPAASPASMAPLPVCW